MSAPRLPAAPPVPLPAALLCDMDGTLVDTERLWLASIAELLERHGVPFSTPELHTFAGATLGDTARMLLDPDTLPGIQLPGTEQELVDHLGQAFTERVSAGVRLRPGALELLDQARRLGARTALVTASERPVAELVLDTLGRHRFDTTVAGDEGGRTKPHPDPYLCAAERLRLAPSRCLAVEDTPTGAASARAAGCRLLVVPTVSGVPEGPRTWFVDSLLEVDLDAAARVET